MDNKELYEKMYRSATTVKADYAVCRDLSDHLINWMKEEPEEKKVIIGHAGDVLNIESRIMQHYSKNGKYHDAENMRNLMFKTLKFSAPYNFDHFMQAMEFNRNQEDRFYVPRRSVLYRHARALQRLADRDIDELFLSQPPRTGKALADNTPVLTKEGWKKHGDLKVGDSVIGIDGKYKKVLAVHPKCTLDREVQFTNGERIVCHENHEWYVCDRGFPLKKEPSVWETKYIENRVMEQGVPGHRKHRYIFQLPKKEYIQGEEKELPMDPYTFGVWLGDGVNTNPTICGDKKDHAIIEKIERNGYPVHWNTVHKTTGVMYYGFGFRPELRKMGLCHSNLTVPKYIPEEYLTASVQQRLELLAGLLDTDGTYRKSEHRYVFTTAEETLRDTFIDLISTFGWRCCVVTYEPTLSSSGIQGKKKTYCVGFNPDCEIPCALERKQNHEFSKYRAVAMRSIARTEPQQGNCITVEGGVYLVGRTMIPTHNSCLTTFFITWLVGRDPERSNLYVSYSDPLTKAFYDGVLEFMEDNFTYQWAEIFPERKITGRNSKDETFDVDRNKKYHSFTSRSLFGTLNGSCDCNGCLIADDLLSGIEEALNPDRLQKTWVTVDNNMLSRAKENAGIVWVGTRWSLADPIGRRLSLLETDPKYKDRRFTVINIPALNEKDESNFNYKFGVGFSSAYYRQRRASFENNNDLASWAAQYQGEPYERSTQVFDPSYFRYYNGELPEGEPDRVFTKIDPAFGGGDYTAAPIVYQYGEEFYVHDVIFNSGNKSVTQPLIARKAEANKITAMRMEANKSTESYADGLREELERIGYHLSVITEPAPSNIAKQSRILDKASDIFTYFIFRDSAHRSQEYEKFMQNVFSYKLNSPRQHDDAPDSLAMTVGMAMQRPAPKAYAFRRPV